jgi:CheY-like chemotaxis protein
VQRICAVKESAAQYVMHFAVSGEQALDMVAGDIRPELIVILSDIDVPGMDGLELLGEVKQRRPDLPVMMVTPMVTRSEDAVPANSVPPSSSPSRSISIS